MKTKLLLAAATVALLSGVTRPARADALADKCRETGDHNVCGPAGAALEAQSPESALELYAAECQRHPGECYSLVAFGQRTLKKKEGPRAAQIFEKGCELRSARACEAIAAETEEGERGIAQDVVKAARFHNIACELGNARACLLLAVMTEDGRGTRRDARAAQRLRAKADTLDRPTARAAVNATVAAADEQQCRKGQDAARCLTAAAAVESTDAAKSEELYRLGCTADKATCGLWGFAIDRFRRDDPSRASRVLDEGCASGAGLACYVLGELNHTGYHAVTRNETRAAELYDKACTNGEPAGCRAVAARYRGVKDVGKADELRAKAASFEAEADKPLAALHKAWLDDALQSGARDPFLRELERKKAEWRLQAARSRTRWDVRMQRLAEIDAGNEASPLTPLPATDAAESTARVGAIKRMSKVLFP